MNYSVLLDLATELGYRLAMSGAETFRVEESINLLVRAYGIEAEVFAIPNCMTVSIKTDSGESMTKLKRIGYHGNDLDAVEQYTNLCRKICKETPDPALAKKWILQLDLSRPQYTVLMEIIGCFIGGAGFALFYGSNILDSVWGGVCGAVIGLVGIFMDRLNVNQFFRTILSSFLMAILAYALSCLTVVKNPDTVIIGALMILVPGLLFTNAMRDIIFGDTNSGINRIVQVFLIAVAIALGTGAAWNVIDSQWKNPGGFETEALFWIQLIGSFIGCIGFSIVFNIHGPGILLCALGGAIGWAVYLLVFHYTHNDILSYFWSGFVAALYSELMARIRKYPAISYLVISIFPLIPGAGVYYAMNYAVRGNMPTFAQKGIRALAIAGVLALGILLVSTAFRIITTLRKRKQVK